MLLILLAVTAIPALAQTAGTEAPLANQQLADPRLEAQATALMHDLRCIQCQGQSIADSDAPIAGAMRSEVRSRIAAGDSPQSVRAWLIGRYGDYVSFEPPLGGASLLLWVAPLLILLFGIWLSRGLFTVRKP